MARTSTTNASTASGVSGASASRGAEPGESGVIRVDALGRRAGTTEHAGEAPTRPARPTRQPARRARSRRVVALGNGSGSLNPAGSQRRLTLEDGPDGHDGTAGRERDGLAAIRDDDLDGSRRARCRPANVTTRKTALSTRGRRRPARREPLDLEDERVAEREPGTVGGRDRDAGEGGLLAGRVTDGDGDLERISLRETESWRTVSCALWAWTDPTQRSSTANALEAVRPAQPTVLALEDGAPSRTTSVVP